MSTRDMKEPIQTRPVQLETRQEATRRDVPKHRQCPLCYSGPKNGVGQCEGTYKKASTLTRRYYKCDQCGHTWIKDFTPEMAKDAVE